MNSFSATWPGRFVSRGSLLRQRAGGKWRGAQPGLEAAASDAMERRLFLIALQARSFLEPVWLDWHTSRGGDIPTPLSRSTCGRSGLFLKRVLQAEYPAPGGGGPPQAYFGFHAGSDWQSHAWVETGNWIIDLTADQFGDEPVIVATRPDPRYQKGVCDSAFPEFVRAHRRAVEKLWSRWVVWSGKHYARRSTD